MPTHFCRNHTNILLLHIGAFDALMLDDLLTAYENQGVKFITLGEALDDPAYNINPNIAKKKSDTFLAQMMLAKKIPIPDSINNLLSSIPEDKLDKICR
jgi:hypothetical protein